MFVFDHVVRRTSSGSLNLILGLSIAFLLSSCGGSSPAEKSVVPPTPPIDSTLTPPPQAAGYHAVFDEEFDSLNLSNTGRGTGSTWYNPGIWWETSAPSSSITDSDGVLSLVWNMGQTPTYDTSISTSASNASSYQAWTYGYFEMRMSFNPTIGSWPGLWLMPTAGITNPNGEHGEIDIFEWQSNTPNKFFGTIHDWVGSTDIANNESSNSFPLPTGTDLSAFHVYGLLWTPTTMSWYFDDQLVGSTPTYSIFGKQSYYLILSQQAGVNRRQSTTGMTTSTLTMNVDWVHVFQQ